MRICLLTVGNGVGGAEKVVWQLASFLSRKHTTVSVIFLKDPEVKIWSLPFWLQRMRFDIVHSHLFWANIAAALFKTNYKLIWHEHDTSDGLAWWQFLLRRALVHRADAVICVSHAVAKEIEHTANRKYTDVHVVHNGI